MKLEISSGVIVAPSPRTVGHEYAPHYKTVGHDAIHTRIRTMAIIAASPSSFDILFLFGALTLLAGLALSLSWVRKLNRERRERRSNAA
jgi:hypothetical protein